MAATISITLISISGASYEFPASVSKYGTKLSGLKPGERFESAIGDTEIKFMLEYVNHHGDAETELKNTKYESKKPYSYYFDTWESKEFEKMKSDELGLTTKAAEDLGMKRLRDKLCMALAINGMEAMVKAGEISIEKLAEYYDKNLRNVGNQGH